MPKKIIQIVKMQKDLSKDTFEELLENTLVSMLGIQASPGTQFMINNGSPIEMGLFGTYELDLVRIGGIVNSIRVKQHPDCGATVPEDSKVILDILCETEGT